MSERLPSSKQDDVFAFSLGIVLAVFCTWFGAFSTTFWSYILYTFALFFWLGGIGVYLEISEYLLTQFLGGLIGLFFLVVAYGYDSLLVKLFWGGIGSFFLIYPFYEDYIKEDENRESRRKEGSKVKGVSSSTSTSFKTTNNKEEDILSEIGDDEFEELVAEIWSEKGWNTNVTTSSLDKGIDVIAKRKDIYEKKALIQVKNYSKGNKVSSTEIQQYASLKQQENNVDEVIMVAKSSFTSNAENRAKDLNVKLVSGEKVEELIEEFINK